MNGNQDSLTEWLRTVAPDVVGALSDPAVAENGPRTVVRGEAELRAALARDAGVAATSTQLLLTRDEGHVVAELAETGPDGTASSVVWVLGLADSAVAQVLQFRHDLVPVAAPPTGAGAGLSVAGVRELVEQYFDDLEAGRVDAVLGHFGDDVIYSFPPHHQQRVRGTTRGQDELRALITARGVNDAHHVVHYVLVDDATRSAAVVGRVIRLPGDTTATFVSTLTIGADGRITRYATRTAVPEVVGPATDELSATPGTGRA